VHDRLRGLLGGGGGDHGAQAESADDEEGDCNDEPGNWRFQLVRINLP
jgi:hypothetical protein